MSDEFRFQHVGFQFKYFLFQQANICSVPQAAVPMMRILGFFHDDKSVLEELERLRDNKRVNRLPIMIGRCHRDQLLGVSLSRSMHGIVLRDRMGEIDAALQRFEEEKTRSQLRRRDATQAEYGMTYDYMSRVMRVQKEARERYGRPEGWTPKQIFGYLLKNAQAPQTGFDHTNFQHALRDMLERARAMAERDGAAGKRVWDLGEEMATSIDEVDWDRTVSKQLERMQIDIEENLDDPEVQAALSSWPEELHMPGQNSVYITFKPDLVEEAANWLENFALGREAGYQVLGCCSTDDDALTDNYVRDQLLGKYKNIGLGIYKFDMYSWFDMTKLFDAKIKRVVNDSTTQLHFDQLEKQQRITNIVQSSAQARNVKIEPVRPLLVDGSAAEQEAAPASSAAQSALFEEMAAMQRAAIAQHPQLSKNILGAPPMDK